jgi:septal ring factor EnvC (AmiA/AmiB activator)
VRRPTLVLSALTVALTCAVPASGDQASPGALRQQANQARSREASLAAQVAGLGQAASRLQRQLGILEQRRTQVRADLAADRTRLTQVQGALRAERARLTRLRARLAQVRATLAERLRASYEAPKQDLTTVIVTSQSLSDLLERTRYLKDVEHQDKQIMLLVRSARADAATQTRRLAVDERRQHDAVVAMNLRARVLAGMSASVRQRRSTLVRVQAARSEALRVTRANRSRIESRLAAVERQIAAQAAQARSFTAPSSSGAGAPSGGWAIPAAIVMCESGGQNLPPNSAGASGYYQILPSTWKGEGGSGPAAYLAPKAEQDRVASALWAGGSGAHNWVCAGIVG